MSKFETLKYESFSGRLKKSYLEGGLMSDVVDTLVII